MAERRYPQGKLNADDLGETAMAITVKNGKVIIAFPYPMDWIGLGYAEAKAIGEAILRRAEDIKPPEPPV